MPRPLRALQGVKGGAVLRRQPGPGAACRRCPAAVAADPKSTPRFFLTLPPPFPHPTRDHITQIFLPAAARWSQTPRTERHLARQSCPAPATVRPHRPRWQCQQ